MKRTVIRILTIGCCLAGLMPVDARADVKVGVKRHDPCNLFTKDEAVSFSTVGISGLPPGEGSAEFKITNFFGEQVWAKSVPLKKENTDGLNVPLEVGQLDYGYYDLVTSVNWKGSDGKETAASGTSSFGVTQFFNRTAKESRDAGKRYGLKAWCIRKCTPLWNVSEAFRATAKMGLQWTRFPTYQDNPNNEIGAITTPEVFANYPMNVVVKIEGYTPAAFDVARYGTLQEWEQKNGKGLGWMKSTVPLKEPYQDSLKKVLSAFPADQNVYEIGNEPYNHKIKPEDYAELCQMTVQAVKEARPDAIVGPNTGLAPIEWEKKFIAAGGMKGMNMVTIHPYSFTPLLEHRTRASIRNYRDFLRAKVGHEVDLYVTEYGWSTAPNDRRKHAVSEKKQAEYTARQSLIMYAEGVKVLIPHWMADREEDPTEREHFFGFFRRNNQPKPVIISHANQARLIDGSRFVGDLWYGPGVGALMFERDGVNTLALWTLDETVEKQIDVGADKVKVVDIMGREKEVKADGGKVTLKLNGSVTYVVGIGASVAKQVIKPSEELNSDLWSKRDGTFTMERAKAAPVIDGDLTDWANAKPVELQQVEPASTTMDSEHAKVYLRWNTQYVYAAVKVKDSQVVGSQDVKKLDGCDIFSLRFGPRPGRQRDQADIHDYTLFIVPAAQGGTPILRMENSLWEQPINNPAAGDSSGIRWATKAVADGWTAEVAVPIKLLPGFPAPQPGSKISCVVRVVDGNGPQNPKTVMANSASVACPRLWPYLVLGD